MRNFDWHERWHEIKRKVHPPQLIMGTWFPEESILQKIKGASYYQVIYHLCNGVPSGSQRFKTRREAEAALDET